MRIGFFSDSYFPEVDGVSYTIESWKSRLEDRGHEVFIIYPDSPNYEPDHNEIPVKSVLNPFYDGYRIPIPIFRSDYPDLDLVHCHSPAFLGLSGLRYSHKQDIPSVYTHHTPIEEYFQQSLKPNFLAKILEKIYPRLEERILKKFDLLIASADSPRRNLDFRKLPVGVDMEFFRPSKSSFFQDVDKEIERPVAGYSGRLSSEKNPLRLLNMAEEFEGTLVIIGEGPLREEVEEKAPENVVVRDFIERDELPRFYSDLDLFVTASTGDTLGLSTLEANACGTPVVAPDVFPFNQTIKGENGMLYTESDLDDFTYKIRSVLKNEWRTREAVEKYSLFSSVDQLEEIYSELTKN